MGEIQNQPFQLSFNASLKVDFQGSRVTSDPSAKASYGLRVHYTPWPSGRQADGGLILMRELDEPLGFGELIEQHLTDSRRGKNTQRVAHQSFASQKLSGFSSGVKSASAHLQATTHAGWRRAQLCGQMASLKLGGPIHSEHG